MTDTFNLKSFIITSSLNERTIYLKLVDTTSFQSYETNVSPSELRLNVQLEDAYKLIVKCLSGDDKDYTVDISINTGIMKVTFNAIVGGYFKIGFEIILKEKLMSNDAQLSLNFNQLEQNQNKKVQDILNKLDCMQNKMAEMNETMDTICDGAVIQFVFIPPVFYPVNKSRISYKMDNISGANSVNWGHLKYFIKLEHVSIDGSVSEMKNLTLVSNKTLTELTITNNKSLTSISPLDNFPNLERITLAEIPNLANIVSSLNNKPHKIKFITMSGSVGGSRGSDLIEYCAKHDITLTVT